MTSRVNETSGSRVGRWCWALVALAIGLTAWSAAGQSGGGFDSFGGKGGGGFGMGEPEVAMLPGSEVTVSVVRQKSRVAPGDQFAVAVLMEFQDGWHAWPSAGVELDASLDFAIRTAVSPGEADWVDRFGTIQWPETHMATVPNVFDPGSTLEAPVYDGRSLIYVPVVVAADAAPGERTLELTVSWQACDDTQCLQPQDRTLAVAVEVVSDATAAVFEESARADFEGFDPAGAFAGDGGSSPAGVAGSDAEGRVFWGVAGVLGLVLLLVVSAVGGFVLNLTPCVLPVIPIKVMTLTQHAANPGRAVYLGSWMALGVVAFWVGIGLPVVVFQGVTDPSRVFGIWWVTTGIGVLIAGMSLGLMGLFSLTLPQKVYMVNPNAETASGSFLFGVMTAVLGLPCFGFVAGGLLPVAATWPKVVTLGVFTGIGVGMALPYLVLSARPSLLKAVPKTGPASELVKQVMGLLLLAAGAYFIGSGLNALVLDYPYLSKQLHWWAAAVFASMAGVWLMIRTFQITPSAGRRVAFTVLAVVIGGLGVAQAMNETAQARTQYEALRAAAEAADTGEVLTTVWNEYTPATLERAREDGRVVVMDFTADWCLNCKALKAAILNREPVKTELMGDDVVMIKVDLTSTRAPGWEKLRSLGQTGIPTLVVYGPGYPDDEPWVANAYTSQQVMGAIRGARGEGAEGVAAASR